MQRAALVGLVGACVLSLLAGCGRETASSVKLDEVAWGEPANGLQAGIAVAGVVRSPTTTTWWDQGTVVKREWPATCRLTCYVRNVSDEPIRILDLRADRWLRNTPSSALEMTVGGTKAGLLGCSSLDTRMNNIRGYVDLAPGAASVVVVSVRPERWGILADPPRPLEAPFEAEVTFTFAGFHTERECEPYDRVTRSYTKVRGLWTGHARSGAVRVRVGRDWARIALLTMLVVGVVTLLSSSTALLWVIWRRRGKAKQSRT